MTTDTTGNSGQPAKVFRRPHVLMPLDLLEATRNKKAISHVYMWLWHYAGEKDRAWPSNTTLAKKAGVNVHDVRASIAWLADRGYIVKHERKGFTAVYEVRSESAAVRRSVGAADQLPRRKRSEPEGVGSNEPPIKNQGTRRTNPTAKPPFDSPRGPGGHPASGARFGWPCGKTPHKGQEAPPTAH